LEGTLVYKEASAAEESGKMSSEPDSAWVRGYVLNSLEDGPACVADLMRFGEAEFGFAPGEIQAAGKHFAVVSYNWNGELYWMRPANLAAIWWRYASR
jgi:hypothetical protein